MKLFNKTILAVFFLLMLTILLPFSTQAEDAELDNDKLSMVEKDGFTILVPQNWSVLVEDQDLNNMFFGEESVEGLNPVFLAKPDNNKQDTFYYIIEETKDHEISEEKLVELGKQTRKQVKETNPDAKILNYGDIKNNINDSVGEYVLYKNNEHYQFVVFYRNENNIISLSSATHEDNHPQYTDLFQYISLNLIF